MQSDRGCAIALLPRPGVVCLGAVTCVFARSNTFPPNRLGRDFVVGDVHGCFRTLDRALAALEFDASRDRLFGVGDLVDRGPHSHEALDWIDHRFTAVTLGNHEDAALGWLEDRLQGSREAPYSWLRSIAPSAYPRWRDALRKIPLAVTVETPHGPVGIVHAESPHRSWLEASAVRRRPNGSENCVNTTCRKSIERPLQSHGSSRNHRGSTRQSEPDR